jgi:hypothetical protein
MPKIIDFGVAKALTQKLTADTLGDRARCADPQEQFMRPVSERIDIRLLSYFARLVASWVLWQTRLYL